MAIDLEKIRQNFPITEEYTYLNHAASTPVSKHVADAMIDYIRKQQQGPKAQQELMQVRKETDELVGKLLNAEPDELTYVVNTSTGIGLAANSIPLEAGDKVIICDLEYPANVYPWLVLQQKKGIVVDIIASRNGGLVLEDVVEHADERTRIVSVSSVEFLTGYRTDLKAIGQFCRSRGIYFFVDGIQSLGVLEMDVKDFNIDVLAAGGLKFLMGPFGLGPMYLRREIINELVPPIAGAGSVTSTGPQNFLRYNLEFQPNANRFQTGANNGVGIAGLGATVKFLLDVGISNVEEHVLRLTDLLVQQLQERELNILSNLDPKHRSAIVSFETPDVEKTYQALTEANVIVSMRYDNKGKPYIRVSPHLYNTEEEIARVSEVIDQT
jgi:cysteine desulfurase/selenocysteine lyase